MALEAGTVGIGYLVMGSLLLFLLAVPLRRAEKPGSRGFALAVLGVALWPIGLGVSYLTSIGGLVVAAWNVRLLASSLIAVGWLLLAVEVTTGRWPPNRKLVPFVAYLGLGQLVTWSNSYHGLVLAPDTAVRRSVIVASYGPAFWAQTGINYLLVLSGTALLAGEWLRSRGIRRRQAAILTLAVVPPILANLAMHSGLVSSPYDPTPIGLVGSGLFLANALYRTDFLDVVPVAREVVMGEMEDAVVTIDGQDRVVDYNGTAADLFVPEDARVGMDVHDFFETVPPAIDDRISGVRSSDTEVSFRVDGAERHFSVSVSSIQQPDDGTARVFVLRDITPIKRRERELEDRESELELLRQVLSRVLRHNIRNKLTTIRGNAELLEDDLDESESIERVESILEASEELLGHSENAGEIERIIERRGRTVVYEPLEMVESITADLSRQYPDAEFHVRGGDPASVAGGPGLETALRCLIENAAMHNDADRPRVWATVLEDGDGVTLSVADDGPGIPDHELAVLDTNEETPLSHGSGVGLWLVTWAADSVGAELTFETERGGSIDTDVHDDSRPYPAAAVPRDRQASTVVSLHVPRSGDDPEPRSDT